MELMQIELSKGGDILISGAKTGRKNEKSSVYTVIMYTCSPIRL